MFSPTASPLPFAQATAAQRAQVLQYLQTRLRPHFPTLPERAFARALAEFRPGLPFTDTRLALPYHDRTQLVQYLASSPELPLLDPPIHGPWALDLAPVQRLYDELVQATNAHLAQGEQVKRFRLLPQPWTVERGELTPTLKPKCQVILRNKEPVLASLFA